MDEEYEGKIPAKEPEFIYKTRRVEVPEVLRKVGYEGEAYVDVHQLGEDEFIISAHSGFKEGVRPLDKMPTSIIMKTEDPLKAIKKADELLADIENWETEKYN